MVLPYLIGAVQGEKGKKIPVGHTREQISFVGRGTVFIDIALGVRDL
jgi:hypothetical protein